MQTKQHAVLWVTSILAGSLFLSSALAATCPTKISQEKSGFWYSHEKPGWKSHRKTSPGVTVSSKSFGGAVYSPSKSRLACVYKASNGKWVALVSNLFEIHINAHAMDKSGKGKAWILNKKHKDYACGKPRVTQIAGCQFDLGKK